MRVLVDGIFFQLANTGIARVWRSLLSRLGRVEGIELFILDRGGCPELPGISFIPFPSYTMTYTAADSLLIQSICDKYRIDVFSSTYYTTAVTTPQVQMVYDMIPEVFGFDLSARIWKEKELALSYASRLACISRCTRDDLHYYYPNIDPSRSFVTYCGVDVEVFNTEASKDLSLFRSQYNLTKPYVVMVGSREQNKGYKNTRLFFDAIAISKSTSLDILCIGGEKEINLEWLASLPGDVRAPRLDLSDRELATAYTGAIALVYPSLYEGFGMPVIEAMASGCPVITTHHGSLAEVAGEAALIISGHDHCEMLSAFHRVQEPAQRRRLIEAGIKQAALYDWDETGERFQELLSQAYDERLDPGVINFHRRWKELRSAQVDVDVGVD